ncbi:MAG: MBL fold metallo-hydrolase [Clostridiales bacterium]|nr:MBL fold metallo-hydrolase [Clostridiales bacterium]
MARTSRYLRTKSGRRYKILLILSLIAAVLAVIGAAIAVDVARRIPDGVLRAYFIDVGQGDASVILWNGGCVVIDAGTEASAERLSIYLRKLGVSKIDCAVFTHPHSDHIGGGDNILADFVVKSVVMPDCPYEGESYSELLYYIEKEGCSIYMATPGDEYSFGDVTMTVLGPCAEYGDENDMSAVVKVTYGDIDFMYTGDAESDAEYDIINYWGVDILDVEVLKVGHHGSYTSTTEEFLAATTPEFAIISCGRQNEYGHPHSKTLARLEKAGASVYRTDEDGTIIIETDGVDVWRCVKGFLGRLHRADNKK